MRRIRRYAGLGGSLVRFAELFLRPDQGLAAADLGGSQAGCRVMDGAGMWLSCVGVLKHTLLCATLAIDLFGFWLPKLDLRAIGIDDPGEFAVGVGVIALQDLDAFLLQAGEERSEVVHCEVDHEITL